MVMESKKPVATRELSSEILTAMTRLETLMSCEFEKSKKKLCQIHPLPVHTDARDVVCAQVDSLVALSDGPVLLHLVRVLNLRRKIQVAIGA